MPGGDLPATKCKHKGFSQPSSSAASQPCWGPGGSYVPRAQGMASLHCELLGEWGHDPLPGLCWNLDATMAEENALTPSEVILGVVA